MVGGALWAALAGVAEDLRRRERDLRRPGPELRRHRADHLADLRPVEAPRRRLHERHGAVPGRDLWLPALAELRISPWALGIALILAVVVVYFLLRGTLFRPAAQGGGQEHAARPILLGMPTWQYMHVLPS
ncbi:MAG: hypothetical protein M0C28_17345 [Candidatus Moduliflexus flocculans]|nr:hypothetical protein [Candidatus Moduliflexus flocculans]